MAFNDLQFLTKLSGILQIFAIVFIFLGGFLQVSRFYFDKKASELRIEKNMSKNITTKNTDDSQLIELKDQLVLKEEEIKRKDILLEEQKLKIDSYETISKQVDKPAPIIDGRTIPKAKLDELITVLSERENESIEISCLKDDQEAFAFATQLKSLFEFAGWETKGVTQVNFTGNKVGLFLVLNDESVYKKAEYLFELFNSVGFESVGKIDKDQNLELNMVVGKQE